MSGARPPSFTHVGHGNAGNAQAKTYTYVGMGADPSRPGGEGVQQRTCIGALMHARAAIVSITLLFSIGIAYNLVFLRHVLPAFGRGGLMPVFFVLFNAAWFMSLWSYFAASFSGPGHVPARWREFVQRAGSGLLVLPAMHVWQPRRVTGCERCSCPRPERAHHCKICDACVLRMDHHCPWINNCIGFANYKHFILLILYCVLGCLVAVFTTLPELTFCGAAVLQSIRLGEAYGWGAEFRPAAGLVDGRELLHRRMTLSEARGLCGSTPECRGFTVAGDAAGGGALDVSLRSAWGPVVPGHGSSFERTRRQRLADADAILFMSFGLLSLGALVNLLILAMGHAPLLAGNKTTIEHNYGGENPYDCGGLMANIEQSFGTFGPDWLLPIAPWEPVTDGVAYPPYIIGLEGPQSGLQTPEARWTCRYDVRPPMPQMKPGSEPEHGFAGWLNACG